MELISKLIEALQQLGAVVLITLASLAGLGSPTVVVEAPAVLQDATTTAPVAAGTSPDEKPEAAEQKLPERSLGASTPAQTGGAQDFLPEAPAVPPTPKIDVNAQTRASLVNILCTTAAGGYLHPISGSGIIIDSRGIILTNAHVGQYVLLKDYLVKNNIQCVVRTGSPASPRYTAELLYLPPAWVAANATKILASVPTGTGEHDYALLRITGTTDPNGTLPASFPALAMTLNQPDTGEQVLLAAYPAGFIDGLTIERNLYQSSAYTAVGALYSFDDSGYVDAFSISGTIVSQAGSSGGAVVDAHDGNLSGIIVTSTASDITAGRVLNAITLAHIDRSLRAAGKGGFPQFLSQNAAVTASNFNTHEAPALILQLETELKKALP